MMHLIVDTNIGSITTEEYYPVILNTNDKSAKKQVECRYYKTKAQLFCSYFYRWSWRRVGQPIKTIISKTVFKCL